METKICSKCEKDLSIIDFNKNSTKKDGLQAWCKKCNAEASKKYFKNRAEKHRQDVKRRKAVGMEYIRSLKDVPCADCNIKYPYWIMQFDHVGDKDFLVSKMYNHSFNRINEEVAKCDTVCANCHADRTFKRINAPITQR